MDEEKPPHELPPDDAELAELMRQFSDQIEKGAGPALNELGFELLSKVCAKAQEAFAHLVDLTPRSDLLRTKCHLLRAQVRLAEGNDAEAEADLDVAQPLLEARLSDIAAGVHADMGRCFSTRARIATKRGDRRGAIPLWQLAVARERHVAALPHVEQPYARAALAEILGDYAGALKQGGEEEAAAATLAEAEAIRREMGFR